jgi:hypothetical protein
MKTPLPPMMRALLCVLLSLSLWSCRSTSVTPPATPEAVPESKPAESRQSETESAAPPSQQAMSKAAPEAIARHLPESRIGTPEKEFAARRVEYNTMLHTRPGEQPRSAAWQYRMTRHGHVVGFEFSNHGGNRILTPRRDAAKNQLFTRDFQFRFDERARQDIHLLVADWAPSRDRTFRLSEIMNSLLVFLPRSFLPAIVHSRGRNIVTLPTGEEVEFDSSSHEILAGVLSESPVDLNPDRAARKFPGVEYLGKGVMIRADARGTDPRIGTTAVITTGIPPEGCAQGSDCARCRVPAKDLWDQTGAVRFKFTTDREFDSFLYERCGFGLPKAGAGFAIASPHGR